MNFKLLLRARSGRSICNAAKLEFHSTSKLENSNIIKTITYAENNDSDRVSLLTEISNSPGALHEVLKHFWKNDINLTHIESKPTKTNSEAFNVYIDFAGRVGEKKTDMLLEILASQCRNIVLLDLKEVPWFPRHISELDKVANKVLEAGSDLESDHPGFRDENYRNRRGQLANIARTFKFSDPLPYITYTDEENATWYIYNIHMYL
jgi:phenylalanine-4-hydroxylase